MLSVVLNLFGLLGLVSIFLSPVYSLEKNQPLDTLSKHAILLDYNSNTILFEKKADEKFAPASLAKLMTAALVFHQLKEGHLNLDSEMVVSTHAWRKGGAVANVPNMLLTPNKRVKVRELLAGLIVGGANDAALTLAENIAGSEDGFVQMMNDYAKTQGFESLTFMNSTGFTDKGQSGSLWDYLKLSLHIMRDYSDYYPIFGQKEFQAGRNKQLNRNPLVAQGIGVDGLITGFLPDAGYHLIASSQREGRRLIVGVAGLNTAQERVTEALKLLEWGYRRYDMQKFYQAGTIIGEVTLYGGQKSAVEVRTPRDVIVPIMRSSNTALSTRLVYKEPVLTPITEGSTIASLQILLDGRIIQETPLEATQTIDKGGVASRARDAVLSLSRQWMLEIYKLVFDSKGSRENPLKSTPPSRMVRQ